MKTLTAAIITTLTAWTLYAAPADDRNWATRVKCELQTAGGESLQTLTWQQGTTPLLSLDQYRLGKAFDATNTVTAIVRFGPSATNQTYFVSVTNYATSGNGYLVQMPTVGTNTAGIAAGWWYTTYFEIAGKRYWTGNGRLDIEATTSTADGLVWQTITCGAQTTQVYTAQAGTAQVARAADTAGTVTGVQSNTLATALQPGATNGIPHASLSGIEGAGTLHVSAAETNKINGALQRSGGTMTGNITMGTNWVVSGQKFGDSAGAWSSGSNFGAFGRSAGFTASGSYWFAAGPGAGYEAIGNQWGAFGYYSGMRAIHTNSHVFGNFAGRMARGNNRMYLDVYSSLPATYGEGGATNDTIFMDSDGKLYLGGGPSRWENASAGGVLRGTWDGAGLTDIPIAGVTGLQGALDGKVSTNDLRVVNALTNFTDAIHGSRGGLNLHNLADADGAGFYSADHYKAVHSMKGQTNVWNSAVTNGGVTINGIALGNGTNLTITGGGGGGGGLSNVVINGVGGTISGSDSNKITSFTLNAASIGAVSNTQQGIAAAGGVVTNAAINLGTNTLTVTTIKPVADATNAVRITKADGVTSVLSVNTIHSRVGINTTNPIGPFDLWSGGVQRFYVADSGAIVSKGNTYYIGDVVRWEGNAARTYIGLWNGATNPQMFTILANGNSGFGVDNPLAKVHVGDSAIIATNLTVGGLSYIKLPSTAQTNGLGSGILYNDAGTIKVMP